MYPLTVKAAYAYVRKAIDELTSTEDIGMLIEPDSVDLHRLVEGFLVEAVVKTHSLAPVLALEGEDANKDQDYSIALSDGVVTISMLTPVLKVLSVKCSDSDYILSDLIPENSAEGRKQLNQYVRGTYDDPRLVLLKKSNGDHKPILKYYTTAETDATKVSFDIEYIPYPEMVEGVVMIAPRMEYAVLNQIVAMVLDSFKEVDLADRFRVKSKEYMEG